MQGVRLGHGGLEAARIRETAPTASKAAGLYMIGTMAKDAAEADGWDDALMLDYRGQVSEATGANLFLVMDGELHTPTPDCFLDGHHPPYGDGAGAAQPDQGGGTRDPAGGTRPGSGGVPGGNRGRSDAGAPDRGNKLHAWADHGDTADGLRKPCQAKPEEVRQITG